MTSSRGIALVDGDDADLGSTIPSASLSTCRTRGRGVLVRAGQRAFSTPDASCGGRLALLDGQLADTGNVAFDHVTFHVVLSSQQLMGWVRCVERCTTSRALPYDGGAGRSRGEGDGLRG